MAPTEKPGTPGDPCPRSNGNDPVPKRDGRFPDGGALPSADEARGTRGKGASLGEGSSLRGGERSPPGETSFSLGEVPGIPGGHVLFPRGNVLPPPRGTLPREGNVLLPHPEGHVPRRGRSERLRRWRPHRPSRRAPFPARSAGSSLLNGSGPAAACPEPGETRTAHRTDAPVAPREARTARGPDRPPVAAKPTSLSPSSAETPYIEPRTIRARRPASRVRKFQPTLSKSAASCWRSTSSQPSR